VESVISRETAFLGNNLLFVAAAVVVFVGTIFPALTEVARGVKINVGPAYFNWVMVPISIGILLLMGIGPLLPWRRATPEQLARNFTTPAAAAVLVALLLASVGVRSPGPLLVFTMVVFVLGTIVLEAVRGTAVRMRRGEGVPLAFLRLLSRNRRRYGGYTVHLGILLMLTGIAGSNAFATQGQAMMRPGERLRIGQYTLEYEGLNHSEQPGIDVTEASIRVWAGSRSIGIVTPQQLFYRTQQQPMHRVAIRSSPREDLYVILSEWTGDGRALIRVLVHPLVSWLWAGGLVIAMGVVLAVFPETRRRLAPAAAPPQGREIPMQPEGSTGGP
jgi:cytochrome c-type biogenesis protein CcmF